MIHHVETLELEQLPCWKDLSAEEYQARVAEIVERVEREAAERRELEGKSYEEISEITGVNLGTVKSRLHRARNSFAQRIEPFLN